MAKSTDPLTFSLVLETENLGMAELDDLRASLDSLKSQPELRFAKEFIVLAGSHISPSIKKLIQKEYPWATIKLTSRPLDYNDSKDEAIKIAQGDIVILTDSDARYQKNWLKNMLSVFKSHPDAGLVSGDTWVKVTSGYAFALNLSWMFLIRPKTTQPKPTNTFSYNNFAIKKKSYVSLDFPKNFPLYRAKGTMTKNDLLRRGIKFYQAPNAIAYHAAPKNFSDWWYRMLINGHDFIAMADFQVQSGKIRERVSLLHKLLNFPLWVGWKTVSVFINAYVYLINDPSALKFLPAAFILSMANICVLTFGAFLTLINRDYLYTAITSYEASHEV